MQKGLEIV